MRILIERAEEAGNPRYVAGFRAGCLHSGGHTLQRLFGQRQHRIKRPGGDRVLARDVDQPVMVGRLLGGLRRLDDDLSRFQRQRANLNDAQDREGKPVLGEGFAHQFAHPPQIAAARHECAQLHHGRAVGRAQQPLQGIAGLLREQSFGRERRDLKNQAARLDGNSARGVFGKLQDLRLFLFFLFSPGRERYRQRAYQRQQPDPSHGN